MVGTEAAAEAWRAVLRLMFESEGRGRMQAVCRASGISPGLAKALMHLSPEQPQAMRDLAEHWGCDASYVTALVDGLEERGFAERRPHPTDRRVKTVVLTARGAEAQAEVLARLWEPPAAFSALAPEEQEQLRDLLRKVAGADEPLASPSTTA